MVDFMLYNKVKIMISYVKSYEGLHMIYYLCAFVIFEIKFEGFPVVKRWKHYSLQHWTYMLLSGRNYLRFVFTV